MLEAERNARLLDTLRRELEDLLAQPVPLREQYRREADYKRILTMRVRAVHRARKKIKTLEEGRDYRDWPSTKLDEE